jgi:hypothetical protein
MTNNHIRSPASRGAAAPAHRTDDDGARREIDQLGRQVNSHGSTPEGDFQHPQAPPVVPQQQDDDLVVGPTPIVNALLAAADSRDLILLTKGGKRRALLVGASLVDDVLRAMDLGPLMPDDAYITIKLDDDLDRQLAEVAARDEARRKIRAQLRGES